MLAQGETQGRSLQGLQSPQDPMQQVGALPDPLTPISWTERRSEEPSEKKKMFTW